MTRVSVRVFLDLLSNIPVRGPTENGAVRGAESILDPGSSGPRPVPPTVAVRSTGRLWPGRPDGVAQPWPRRSRRLHRRFRTAAVLPMAPSCCNHGAMDLMRYVDTLRQELMLAA